VRTSARNDVEVRCLEVARKTAGVLHAQSLLSQTLWTLPWRGTPRHDQLTDVVHIDYGSAVGGQGKKPRGCALAHRWTPVSTSGERIHAFCLTSYIDQL